MPNGKTPSGAAELKILVVEDDKFLQKILTTKFGKEGFDVRAAADGEEALRMAITESPSVILLDLILPKMTGFEVLAELKTNAKTKNVPVIVLSNLGQDEDIRRAKELGALEFFVKADVSINEVVRKVKELYAVFLQKRQ
jgi:DNA-binding response OmpR family regulator